MNFPYLPLPFRRLNVNSAASAYNILLTYRRLARKPGKLPDPS